MQSSSRRSSRTCSTAIVTTDSRPPPLLVASMRLPNRLLVLITNGIAYDQEYEGPYADRRLIQFVAERHSERHRWRVLAKHAQRIQELLGIVLLIRQVVSP